MVQQVVDFMGTARIVCVQPGDGTRYTVVVGDTKDPTEVLVAVGYGDGIVGGGTCNREMLKEAFPASPAMNIHGTDMYFCGEWGHDVGIKNAWSAVIALAVAWCIVFHYDDADGLGRWVERFGAYYTEQGG